MKKIILFGDSITEYSFKCDMNGFGSQLQDVFSRKMDIIQRGFSGYNTKWCKIIFPRILSEFEPQEVALITIFLGANDAVLPDMNPHQSVEIDQYKLNLKDMITYVHGFNENTKILLISPPPVQAQRWAEFKCRELDRNSERTRSYYMACEEVYNEMKGICSDNISFLNLFSKMTSNDDDCFCDGLHLSSKGNNIVFQGIMEVFENNWKELLHPSTLKLSYPLYHDIDDDNSELSLL